MPIPRLCTTSKDKYKEFKKKKKRKIISKKTEECLKACN